MTMLVADESTGLYQKSWQEIYEMLKKEIQTTSSLTA